MTVARSFDYDTASVRAARRFVAEHLHDLDPATRSDALLLVSELATNAVRHAQSPFTVTLRRSRSAVRVEVTDQGPGEPVAPPRDVRRTTGRGLQLVDDLSHEWGVDPGPDRKVVWFTVALAVG